MKVLSILFLAFCSISNAETADKIARGVITVFVGFDNGLDDTSDGRRRTALNNAEFNLAYYMASDKVPEGVRISYALGSLKDQLRGSVFKEVEEVRMNEEGVVLFEVDEEGVFVVDEEKTREMRKRLMRNIEILEQRLVEIYHPSN